MRRYLVVLGLLAALAPRAVLAVNCAGSNTGLVALPDLGTAIYLKWQGGLYPGGRNTPPEPYRQAGLQAGAHVLPRDGQGQPDGSGTIVLLTLGMSNTDMESRAFQMVAGRDALRDQHVLVIDGAQGGQDAAAWVRPDGRTWAEADHRLAMAGAGPAQVQAIWLKQALAGPTDVISYVNALADDLRRTVAIAAQRYPNLEQVFVSPRIYAGYGSTPLNPEPYAYATGFADQQLVAGSVQQPGSGPWIGWGPYLWADGANASDGLTWSCQDLSPDGTHPSRQGAMKVAGLLQNFFDNSEFTTWYRGGTTGAALVPSLALP